MWMRTPVVAGQFYPIRPEKLKEYLREAIPRGARSLPAVGLVAPHAGYMYSGGVAGQVYGAVDVPDTVLLLGPNHTGRGSLAAIVSEGTWATPLGTATIDKELAQALMTRCPLLKEDIRAHDFEHSLEVQLPFIQHKNPKAAIVPIAFMLRSPEEIETVGRSIGEVLKGWGKPVLMVASSDMTHYESADSAKTKDALAIEKVLDLNPAGLLETVGRNQISMCGVIPTAVMLWAARALGAKEAKMVAYATSGDVSGDFGSVVGYAGIVIR
jgi:AmmeMemoRadiSam system protein B